MNPAPMLFSQWEPDPVIMGIRLKTGFSRFRTYAGLHGLAKVDGERLDVLAVFADKPGRGDFRRFVAQAKELYAVVAVWGLWNPFLPGVLERYGFRPTREVLDGHEVDGMRWDKSACRCDACAPEFDCWNVPDKCRKPAGHSPRPPMVEDDDNPFLQ